MSPKPVTLNPFTGTVITTGNFPNSLDSLHIVGDLLLDGTFTVFSETWNPKPGTSLTNYHGSQPNITMVLPNKLL